MNNFQISSTLFSDISKAPCVLSYCDNFEISVDAKRETRCFALYRCERNEILLNKILRINSVLISLALSFNTWQISHASIDRARYLLTCCNVSPGNRSAQADFIPLLSSTILSMQVAFLDRKSGGYPSLDRKFSV